MTLSIDPWKLFRVMLAFGAIILVMSGRQSNERWPEGIEPGCSMMHGE